MTITQADWSDILTVLHESREIWSPGLQKDQYQDYIWRSINHPWARRNYKFIVLKEHGRIVCSCKLYDVSLNSRGESYRFGGIGAVYTMKQARGQGFASKMIQSVLDACSEDGYDGAILFSDISPDFYAQFGFLEFGAADFGANLPRSPEFKDYVAPEVAYVEDSDVQNMIRIYKRWQRSQPFAFDRDEKYLDYKLAKERYLADHSTLAWPRLEITYALENGTQTGYALTERGGHNLRILELIGTESARHQLWWKLIEHAITHRMHKIRGWESVATDLFPGFRLEQVLPAELVTKHLFKPLTYSIRTWGRPMFLSFDESLDDWADFFPCPILELDHL
ncbi:MAG TPA: GNAT family N-acetyltransferase [Drouetiella sp.]